MRRDRSCEMKDGEFLNVDRVGVVVLVVEAVADD